MFPTNDFGKKKKRAEGLGWQGGPDVGGKGDLILSQTTQITATQGGTAPSDLGAKQAKLKKEGRELESCQDAAGGIGEEGGGKEIRARGEESFQT